VTTLFIAVAAAASAVPDWLAAAGALEPCTVMPPATVWSLWSSAATRPPPARPPSTALSRPTATSRPPGRGFFGSGAAYGQVPPLVGGVVPPAGVPYP
jgi:hypothetical protein